MLIVFIETWEGLVHLVPIFIRLIIICVMVEIWAGLFLPNDVAAVFFYALVD